MLLLNFCFQRELRNILFDLQNMKMVISLLQDYVQQVI